MSLCDACGGATICNWGSGHLTRICSVQNPNTSQWSRFSGDFFVLGGVLGPVALLVHWTKLELLSTCLTCCPGPIQHSMQDDDVSSVAYAALFMQRAKWGSCEMRHPGLRVCSSATHPRVQCQANRSRSLKLPLSLPHSRSFRNSTNPTSWTQRPVLDAKKLVPQPTSHWPGAFFRALWARVHSSAVRISAPEGQLPQLQFRVSGIGPLFNSKRSTNVAQGRSSYPQAVLFRAQGVACEFQDRDYRHRATL